MRYEMPGSDTSAVEVTNVSKHGLWIMVQEEEFFHPFETFPWFRHAPIDKLIHVELPSENHLYWPELDVDLEVDSLIHPDRYPLISKVTEPDEPYAAEASEGFDGKKVEDCVLALFQLTLHDADCAWKGFDFEVLDRLFQKGFILNPRNKNKSVVLTEAGLLRSKQLFRDLFAGN